MNRIDSRSLKISWPIRGLLVITLGLIAFAYFRGEHEDASVQPAPVPARVSTSADDDGKDMLAAHDVAEDPAAPIDLFPSQNWQPPPPPPPPPDTDRQPPPAPPEPPPLPFSVRTLWLDQHGIFYVVLAGTGREFPLCANCQKRGFLHRGDVILNAYRIDHIDRKEVRFTYLPLKRRQTLALGELK